VYKYIGNGFVPGIPARDLTEEEAEEVGVDLVEASKLYKHIPQPSVKTKEKEKEGEQ